VKASDRLSGKVQALAKALGYSPEEIVRVSRFARPVTHEWWTHRYEQFLFRTGDKVIHDMLVEGQEPERTTIPRHLLMSARDSINDLLTSKTPKPERETAEWVLEEIRKELEG
jgi:hypothetical protein